MKPADCKDAAPARQACLAGRRAPIETIIPVLTGRFDGDQRMEKLEIRDARAADVRFLVAGNRSMARETEGVELDPALLEPGVAAVLADPALGRYFVAEASGAPLGQLMLTYEWSDWRNGAFWWIQSVFVIPEQRGRGVFSALYRHAADLAGRTPGVCGLRLYVDRGNARAQDIYAHLGLHHSNYEVMERVFRGPASRRED